jgi:hypothetical protein
LVCPENMGCIIRRTYFLRNEFIEEIEWAPVGGWDKKKIHRKEY